MLTKFLVRNSYCGICGTDLHEYLHGPIQIPQKSHLFSKSVLPLILGYEFSGVVVETGSEVQEVRVGDRVSIQPNVILGAMIEPGAVAVNVIENSDLKPGDSILVTGG